MIQALVVFGIIYAYIFVGVLVYKVLGAVVGYEDGDVIGIGCGVLWPISLPCIIVAALVIITDLVLDKFAAFVSGFWESLRA